MAIVFAFKQWGHYLRGASDTITVRADHNNLRYFMTKKRLSSRQARWAEALADFDFVIEYRPGKTNPADGPSRRPDYRELEASRNEESCLPTLYNKLRIARLGVPHDLTQRSSVVAETGPRHPQTDEMSGLTGSHQDRKGNPGRATYMQEPWAQTLATEYWVRVPCLSLSLV